MFSSSATEFMEDSFDFDFEPVDTQKKITDYFQLDYFRLTQLFFLMVFVSFSDAHVPCDSLPVNSPLGEPKKVLLGVIRRSF